jgi:NADH dehydrogenase
VDVLVIDRNNYHVFQPLLYQVASAALAPAAISQPIRHILHKQKNAFVMMAQVTGVDLERRCVLIGADRVPYDYLILAAGASDNYFGKTDWHKYAPGMKGIDDATRIRSRLLLSFETAEIEADTAARDAHLTFVIVGGGPTGVELAGAIKELAVDVIPADFRVADTRQARVILIEAGPRLLPALDPKSSQRALEQLRALGVEVRLGERVTDVRENEVQVGDQVIRSHNIIWAAGVKASTLATALGVEMGPGGRIKVEPDCSIPKHSEAFAIGDIAFLIDPIKKVPVPGVSQGALQMGKYVADVIREDTGGRTALRTRGFRYRDYGAMATIGKSRAVAEIGPLRFSGLIAWIAWLLLHITVLIGFRNRLGVLAEWIYDYVFFRRGSRLITGLEPGRPTVLRSEPTAESNQ